jgi:bifunctional DNA-binding transcriptional regulator/antitoxin component of YhaV-PrlF toxin-antitoxin module
MTASELMEDDRLKSYVDGDKIVKMTNQKLSALLTSLKNDKKLNREEIKKKAYFSIA